MQYNGMLATYIETRNYVFKSNFSETKIKVFIFQWITNVCWHILLILLFPLVLDTRLK